jgi:hypothetical protein
MEGRSIYLQNGKETNNVIAMTARQSGHKGRMG